MAERFRVYDPFAWFYNRHWGGPFSRRIFPILQRLLLRELPPGARILDLCCGTGQLARLLSDEGFRVLGLDGSRAMLAYARRNAPAVEFRVADARSFELPVQYDAVVSVFDSLNHVLRREELAQVFRNVYKAVRAGGAFVFDLNTVRIYRDRSPQTTAIVQSDHVCVVQRAYDARERLARWDLILFRRLRGEWRRADVTVTERWYRESEVRAALAKAGFRDPEVYEAEKDLGMTGHHGRVVFVARR